MKNSKIAWTNHTFNPWIGCTKVSPGCEHCYAESLNRRMKWTDWGDAGNRYRTSESNWNEPLRWNAEAIKNGTRPRVFCASLSDWLDTTVPTQWHRDLVDLIQSTQHLDWLLLTKRPQNWKQIMEKCKNIGSNYARLWLNGATPKNVWIGVSAEDNQRWGERNELSWKIPASVHFVSAEPLLGPIMIRNATDTDWLIVGGESGVNARYMNTDWVRSLRDQAKYFRIPFFFKQWGAFNKENAGRLLDGKEYSEFPTTGVL